MNKHTVTIYEYGVPIQGTLCNRAYHSNSEAYYVYVEDLNRVYVRLKEEIETPEEVFEDDEPLF